MPTYTLEVIPDEDPSNPREEYDNLTTMVCFHRRYILGDKHEYNTDDASSWDGMRDLIAKDNPGGLIILPLFLYEHSGITISTGEFDCSWDSGQVGFIYMSVEEFTKNCEGNTEASLDEAKKILEADVQTYDQYLRGDMWGYSIEDGDGNFVDSCWGFYGEESCREEGESQLAYFEQAERERVYMLDRQHDGFPLIELI